MKVYTGIKFCYDFKLAAKHLFIIHIGNIYTSMKWLHAHVLNQYFVLYLLVGQITECEGLLSHLFPCQVQSSV